LVFVVLLLGIRLSVAAGPKELKVELPGSGKGTVTSSPSSINCPGDCKENYAQGTTVTLTATGSAGSVFARRRLR